MSADLFLTPPYRLPQPTLEVARRLQKSSGRAEKHTRHVAPMRPSVSMIGLSPDELPWIRTLIALLRHPDPVLPELTRQALLYLSRTSAKASSRGSGPTKIPRNTAMLNCMK